ncbi:MAG: hypothetical protein L6Q26_00495 [Anaerolineales bacterium]|nr:hypothetical protein [Anaerolineales bacterium]
MSFLKKQFSSESAKPEKRYYTFNVKWNRCFQQIEVELTFDSSRQLPEKAITGGEFLNP